MLRTLYILAQLTVASENNRMRFAISCFHLKGRNMKEVALNILNIDPSYTALMWTLVELLMVIKFIHRLLL